MSDSDKTSLSRKKIKTFSSHEERYEFVKEQGSGGVGRVYVAYDKKIGRKIAFKELLTQNLRDKSEETETRFIREAKLTSQLEHPSIVTVHEVDLKNDGTPYYTMRRVKGKTLHTAIYESHRTEQPLRLLPHFRDLCNAVAYAHSRGIIHRDIKPENVMIGEFGETVVLDWGLAKMRGNPSEKEENNDIDMNFLCDKNPLKTISGKPLGTPAYMSPEQAMGETYEIDEKSDIFSLGAVLYEMLSGRQPFEGSTTLEIINKVLHSEAPEIAGENPPPQELIAISKKAMQKKKEDRYSSASELSTDIANYLSGQKISSYEYSSWELLKHFANRNKTIIASVFVIIITVITAMFVSINAYRKEAVAREKQEKQRMKANFHISQALNEKARRLSVNREHLSSAVYAAEALRNNPVFPGSPYHREDTQMKFPGAFNLIADSSSLIYRAIAEEIYAVEKIVKTDKTVQSVSISPDNLVFAVGTSDGTVYIKKMNSGENIRIFQLSDKEISDIAWFPDSTFIAVSSGKTITVISVEGRKKYQLTPHEDTITSVDLSVDGKYMLSGSVDKTVILFRASDGKILKKRKLHKDAVLDTVFSNSSKFIASAGGDRNIIISSLPDLKVVSVLKGHTNAVHRIDFSRNDKLLASGGWDRKLIIWNFEEKEILNTIDPSTDTVFDVSFSHDIPRIFSANRSGYINIFDYNNENITPFLNINTMSGPVASLEVTSDGKHFISASRNGLITLWKNSNRGKVSEMKYHSERIMRLAVSSRKNQIATAGLDGNIVIWDMKSAEPLHVFPGNKSPVFGISFSDDGRLLASVGMDKILRIWDMENKKQTHVIRGHSKHIISTDFSPDSTVVATASWDTTVSLWNVKTGENIRTMKEAEDSVWGVKYSPDGSYIAAASSDENIYIYKNNGDLEKILENGHKDWVSGVYFSPDSRKLYSSGKDAEIVRWDVETGKKEHTFSGHSKWVSFIAVSENGKFLASGSDDRTLKIWSLENDKPLITIPTSDDAVALSFADGESKLVLGDGKNLKVYPLDFSFMKGSSRGLSQRIESMSGLELDGFILSNIASD